MKQTLDTLYGSGIKSYTGLQVEEISTPCTSNKPRSSMLFTSKFRGRRFQRPRNLLKKTHPVQIRSRHACSSSSLAVGTVLQVSVLSARSCEGNVSPVGEHQCSVTRSNKGLFVVQSHWEADLHLGSGGTKAWFGNLIWPVIVTFWPQLFMVQPIQN